MGWLFGWETRKELEQHLLAPETWFPAEPEYKLLAHAWVGNNLWILAPRFNDVTKKHDGAPTVILFKCAGRNNSQHGWGYKDMDEGSGPYDVSCPLSYLDRAGEPPNDYAREWRIKVRAHYAAKAAERERAKKLVPGAVVKLKDNLTVNGQPVRWAKITAVSPRRIDGVAGPEQGDWTCSVRLKAKDFAAA
jgi:hypothetical protein